MNKECSVDSDKLMIDFPASKSRQVTPDNQFVPPNNLYSFKNFLSLNKTRDIWRGEGMPYQFDEEFKDLSDVAYINRFGNNLSLKDTLIGSLSDSIVVLQNGKLVYENYLNGMKPHTLHAGASIGKSIVGLITDIFISERWVDPTKYVTYYLPELKETGFADATISEVLDMTTGIGFAPGDEDPFTESFSMGVVLGFRPKPIDYDGPENVYDFLKTIRKTNPHGERFNYLTANTEVLAWIIKRISNKTLSVLVEETIWKYLGAERDAFWMVESTGAEAAGSGFISTTRDLARFGEMIRLKGKFNGTQIVDSQIIETLKRGGDCSSFEKSPLNNPGTKGFSYKSHWWFTHNANNAFMALGYGGQLLYIDPIANVVVAKYGASGSNTPGFEFYGERGAIKAIINALTI